MRRAPFTVRDLGDYAAIYSDGCRLPFARVPQDRDYREDAQMIAEALNERARLLSELEGMTALYNTADREAAKHRGDAADLRRVMREALDLMPCEVDADPSECNEESLCRTCDARNRIETALKPAQ